MLNSMNPAADELLRLIRGYWITQVIAVAAELRIPDLLDSGLHRVEDLAEATHCHALSLHRLLRALASLGLLDECDGAFTLTSTGRMLESDNPDSLRTLALWAGTLQWQAWGRLLDCVKSGQSADMVLEGTDSFRHMAPETADIFHNAMIEATRLIAEAVVTVYDFSVFKRLVDVCGGYAEMLVAVLRACPNLHAILLDRSHAVDGARKRLERAGVAHRCELMAGDFFVSIPGGADGYLLKSIIHDWSDERAQTILGRCRDVMRTDGKLVLVEQIMPDRLERSPVHQEMVRKDLTMLVMHGGRERTASEYRELLDSTKFSLTTI